MQQDLSDLPAVRLLRDTDRADVAARLRSGAWHRLRRGAFLVSDVDPSPMTLARARVAALHQQLTVRYVFSHTSAALVWGLPLRRAPKVAEIIQATKPGNRGSGDVVRHVDTLLPEERTTFRGMPVTTLERTVADCAMTLPLAQGLVVADAALHVGADRERCAAILARLAGHRGVVRARRVLDLADDGAESPGETLARLAVIRSGMPRPVTQVRIETRIGVFWSDLGWPELGLLAEYDGAAKYGVTAADAAETVLAEKRRQEAIEDEGWGMGRITSPDLADPPGLRRRLEARRPTAPRPALGRETGTPE